MRVWDDLDGLDVQKEVGDIPFRCLSQDFCRACTTPVIYFTKLLRDRYEKIPRRGPKNRNEGETFGVADIKVTSPHLGFTKTATVGLAHFAQN